MSIFLATSQATLAQPACPGVDGSIFRNRLHHWLARLTIATAPALVRDPISGTWRVRLGLVVTVHGGQHARVVAPGRIIAASCKASCSLVADHGSGYVIRYGGLAHARFRTGACAGALTSLALKRRSDGKGQLTLDLSRNGRSIDPRDLAGKRAKEP
jgi:hypothetical protein